MTQDTPANGTLSGLDAEMSRMSRFEASTDSGGGRAIEARGAPGLLRPRGWVGHVLGGRYELTHLLGQGGMGVVYLARESAPPREVVVKLISPELQHDAEVARRFEREAQRLASLRHPNIVKFYEFGRDGDLAYLVMEYIYGVALSEVLARRHRFTLEEFVPIAAQVLKGVGYAHSRDVLLRDIKPSNIMLCLRDGRANFVKLLDFGLAKLLDGERPITKAQVLGTTGFIAPEVLRGSRGDLRSDVYALGVLSYLMLSGRQPFESPTPAVVLSQTLNDEPPPLRGLVPDAAAVPPGLFDLIHRCLEKAPERRPADANAVVEQLIDAVPASLFRLPRTSSSSSSGDMDITADRSRPLASSPPRQGEFRGPTTVVDEVEPQGQSSAGPATTQRTSSRLPIYLAASLTAGAVLGVAAWVVVRDDETATVVAPPPTVVSAGYVESKPAAPYEVPEVDEETLEARLRDAERALAAGDRRAAVDAYLDVLDMEPEHPSARAALEQSLATPHEAPQPASVPSPPVTDVRPLAVPPPGRKPAPARRRGRTPTNPTSPTTADGVPLELGPARRDDSPLFDEPRAEAEGLLPLE